MRKALTAQSRPVGAKAARRGALHRQDTGKTPARHRQDTGKAPVSPVRLPCVSRGSPRHGSAPWYYPLQPIPPPVPSRRWPGKRSTERRGSWHEHLRSSPPVKLVWWSAAVPKSCSMRAKLLVPTAAPATPHKQAKPEPWHKQRDATRWRGGAMLGRLADSTRLLRRYWDNLSVRHGRQDAIVPYCGKLIMQHSL